MNRDLTVQIRSFGSWDLRSQSLVAHDDRRQRGKVCNACVTFVNLMVVNDYGSSDEISSVGLSLLTTLLPWNLNGIVPPHSGFVVNLSKKEISVKRSLPGHSLKQIKGDSFPRTAGQD